MKISIVILALVFGAALVHCKYFIGFGKFVEMNKNLEAAFGKGSRSKITDEESVYGAGRKKSAEVVYGPLGLFNYWDKNTPSQESRFGINNVLHSAIVRNNKASTDDSGKRMGAGVGRTIPTRRKRQGRGGSGCCGSV